MRGELHARRDQIVRVEPPDLKQRFACRARGLGLSRGTPFARGPIVELDARIRD